MWGGSPDRNMVSGETGIPVSWDLKAGKNVKWVSRLGSVTYGNPTIAGGKIFVATNNGSVLRPGIEGDKGVVVCLDEKTGKFLWQATHDKLPTGSINDWPEQGIASAPWVDGDRLYYVSNECQLVCADVDGFMDGENDGPFKKEKHSEKQDADIVWILDMFKDLKVRPHNLSNCSPVGSATSCSRRRRTASINPTRRLPIPEHPIWWPWTRRRARCVGAAVIRARTCCTGSGLRPPSASCKESRR